MGIFSSLTTLAVVKDVVTLGGSTTGEETPYTAQQLEKIIEDLFEE